PSSAGSARDYGPVGPTATAAHGYVPGLVRSTGSDRAAVYDVPVPTITGGSAAVVERFTESMRASLADRIGRLRTADRSVTVRFGQLANGEGSRVSRIGAGAVAGILLTNFYQQGAAHPNNQIGTVVIDTATAQPILLSQLLPGPAAVERVEELIRRQGTDSTPNPFLNGSTALANWLPTATGITFYVPVAHAAGDFWPFALSWADLEGILPADVAAALRR
ncbi:hypothetical protein KFZ73_19610, partial [Tsukamurella paurometabola]|nr:hypothetical protein [Tsukamurella paurometabola]